MSVCQCYAFKNDAEGTGVLGLWQRREDTKRVRCFADPNDKTNNNKNVPTSTYVSTDWEKIPPTEYIQRRRNLYEECKLEQNTKIQNMTDEINQWESTRDQFKVQMDNDFRQWSMKNKNNNEILNNIQLNIEELQKMRQPILEKEDFTDPTDRIRALYERVFKLNERDNFHNIYNDYDAPNIERDL